MIPNNFDPLETIKGPSQSGNNETMASLVEWIQTMVTSLQYGEIGISMTMHQGKVVRTSKIFTEMKKSE